MFISFPSRCVVMAVLVISGVCLLSQSLTYTSIKSEIHKRIVTLVSSDNEADYVKNPEVIINPNKVDLSSEPHHDFPKREYNIPKCNPVVNKTVDIGACQLLKLTVSESHRQAYMRQLKYLDDLAIERNWTYFMIFGTLVGSWRHHALVPSDYDADVMMDYEDRFDLLNTMEAQQRFIPKQTLYSKIHIHDARYIRGTVYYKPVGRWYTPSLDIFFYKQNKTHIFSASDSKKHILKKSLVFPLHKRPLETFMLPAPRDPVQILIDKYGSTSLCKRQSKFTECKNMKPYLPFVHRKWQDGKMIETLMLNDRVLHVKEVDELKENIPLHPYTFETKGKIPHRHHR
ncbi:uncharacterized protein LOC141902378 isoform X1 [Tubulanus polymorphus]|uniref:uncharacterized protein LOC141902378 isoform X1 n=1 Tax=Tubulanus polymorphus TaxID=672921 RepID=UPI003DA4D9A4